MAKNKFLLVPNTSNPYDLRMMKSLGQALEDYGCEYLVSSFEEELYLNDCLNYKPNIVLAVNKCRPKNNNNILKDVRYLSWYQDVFPETYGNLDFNDGDILYLLGTPEQLGLNTKYIRAPIQQLYTGIDAISSILAFDKCHDFSLCGGLPLDIDSPTRVSTLFNFLNKSLAGIFLLKLIMALRGRNFLGHYFNDNFINECKILVGKHYKPLTGTLDINVLFDELNKLYAPKLDGVLLVDNYMVSILNKIPSVILNKLTSADRIIKLKKYHNMSIENYDTYLKNLSSWMSQSYPRILERKLLISYAESVSNNIAIYGNSMDKHGFSKKYYKGILESDEALSEVYAKSRINLGNNTHGLGIHSRNLGVMSVGGYLLHHRSPSSNPGSLEYEFIEGEHYEAYSSREEFVEVSSRALVDQARTKIIGNNGFKLVQAKHQWKHRALQIMQDLYKF